MRYKIKNKFRFTVFLLVVLFSLISIFSLSANALTIDNERTIIVKKGETLWSIAEDNFDYNKEDIREYIYNIKILNNLKVSNINSGQELKLPY